MTTTPESRDSAIRHVVQKCNLLPGATTWNAAEFMYDLLAAAPAAPAPEPVASGVWPETLAEHLAERHKHLMLEREREAFHAAQSGDKSRQSIASTESERHRAVYHAMCLIVSDENKRGPAIPRAENCGRYLAEGNDGRLFYLNHANTWQECPNFLASPPAPVAASAVDDLPFRRRDIERGLILFRTSSNAHGSINFVSLASKVDALPQPAKNELANLMRNIAQGLSPIAATPSSPNPVADNPAADRVVNAPRVRELVWTDLGNGTSFRALLPIIGSVRVEPYGCCGWWEVLWSMPGMCDKLIPDVFDNPEDAKAAAQSDYERRVLACLEPGRGWRDPSPPAAEGQS
ncbi:hypothetical protein GCM10019059_44970 [Camelimonas fluminis]|uniref:Uncharacterized protein n=1 Tax=Camelimonas fluminis TaxID=1576911 RepID=A0ABV7UPM3_9HYPH|nr:hypothetical protein [Camelimonas fluminis]GHE82591.1 hypothetical protein GCM10019059_44970 [Camelimonas fluminis]